MMILFTCPNTREHAQHFVPDDDPLSEREYVGFRCQGCSKVHFVDQNGKVFRADEPSPALSR
jgi:hypothetical protein